MFKKIRLFTALFLLSLSSQGLARETANPAPILGRIIITSSGSSGVDYMMPIAYNYHGRHKVLLGYLSGMELTGEAGFSFADRDADTATYVGDLRSTATIHYVMINCQQKTYSHFPSRDADNATIKEFYNGNSYKWGEYDGLGKTFFFAPMGKKEVTQLFEDACEDKFF